MKTIERTTSIILTLLIAIIGGLSCFAATPQEALDKARRKLASASTVTADFSMKVNGQTVKGKLQSKGQKFALTSNVTSNWYNGKDLYTYNSAQKETTVFRPTASEVAEVNPLLYLNRASDFKVSGSKQKKPGIETIVLIPSKAGTGIKSVTMELDASTFLPQTVKIQPSTGSAITISLSGIKLNTSIADSTFEYPKTKYPGVSITDMR